MTSLAAIDAACHFFNRVGDDFQSYVSDVILEVEALSREIGVIQ